MTEYCVIFTNATDAAEAEKITIALLSANAAACISRVSAQSAYWWKGKIDTIDEFFLQIKTRADLFPTVEKIIRENCSCEIPELFAIPIIAGGKDYLDWIKEETKG